MICPVCGHENLQGEDSCENCGADLRTADLPQPSGDFETRLVAAQLGRLDAAAPVAMTGDASVLEAIRALQSGSTECVLVEDQGRLVGVFTERDALLKLAARPLDGVRLGDVMTRDPVVLRADDSMAVAIHKMAVGGFRHIPLVESGAPTGVISARDIFRHILGVLDRPAR
jgi:CBS domain-containing protein